MAHSTFVSTTTPTRRFKSQIATGSNEISLPSLVANIGVNIIQIKSWLVSSSVVFIQISLFLLSTTQYSAQFIMFDYLSIPLVLLIGKACAVPAAAPAEPIVDLGYGLWRATVNVRSH